MEGPSGTVILVTGAARGLGASMARALAVAGWTTIVNDWPDEAGALSVVTQILAAGGKADVARFDVTDAEAVRSGLASIADRTGPVDCIVNNATGPQPSLPIERQTWDNHLDQLRFFVKAPLLLLQAALPDWRMRGVGRVINIGSEVVDIGNSCSGHYVAAKAAMLGLTRSWARELGPEGITVNLVAPGWIPVERHQGEDPKVLDDYLKLVAMGRLGRPSDLDGMIVFLASKSADFITGQTFAVNGGRTLA